MRLAGGNAAVLKLSEIAAHTSALMAELVPCATSTRRPSSVVEGASEEFQCAPGRTILDLIFFYGGSRVGQIVLEKVAKHLTPGRPRARRQVAVASSTA